MFYHLIFHYANVLLTQLCFYQSDYVFSTTYNMKLILRGVSKLVSNEGLETKTKIV